MCMYMHIWYVCMCVCMLMHLNFIHPTSQNNLTVQKFVLHLQFYQFDDPRPHDPGYGCGCGH